MTGPLMAQDVMPHHEIGPPPTAATLPYACGGAVPVDLALVGRVGTDGAVHCSTTTTAAMFAAALLSQGAQRAVQGAIWWCCAVRCRVIRSGSRSGGRGCDGGDAQNVQTSYQVSATAGWWSLALAIVAGAVITPLGERSSRSPTASIRS